VRNAKADERHVIGQGQLQHAAWRMNYNMVHKRDATAWHENKKLSHEIESASHDMQYSLRTRMFDKT
jgi:hypothetical protein